MTTTFITGATGQDGSYLVEQLHERGHRIVALTRAQSNVNETSLPPYVEAILGDLSDSKAIASAVESVAPDLIFNLGGISSVSDSWKDPELTAAVSGTAVVTLLESAREIQERVGKPVRFIQASSSEIFGRTDAELQSEATSINPLSPYGATKAFAHHLVKVYRSQGVFASNAILFNHESPRRPISFVTRKITSEVARIARGQSDRIVLGNLDASRDWGWAPDYVAAMVKMADAEAPGDFVIATGEAHTVREFVAFAFAAVAITEWEKFVEIDESLLRPDDAPTMRGDSSRARSELGWTPTKDLSEVISAMVAHDLSLIDA